MTSGRFSHAATHTHLYMCMFVFVLVFVFSFSFSLGGHNSLAGSCVFTSSDKLHVAASVLLCRYILSS